MSNKEKKKVIFIKSKKVEKNFKKCYNLIINGETEDKTMKTMKKLLLIAVILLLEIILMQNTVMAYTGWGSKINSVSTASVDESNGAVKATNSIAKSIITITRTICMGVAVTMLIVLAIKYMSAAPGDKATIKKSAVTYVVGAIVMFAAAGILSIIEAFATVI